jgi:hypothetical protein
MQQASCLQKKNTSFQATLPFVFFVKTPTFRSNNLNLIMTKPYLIVFTILFGLFLMAETVSGEPIKPVSAPKVDRAYLDGSPNISRAALSDIIVVHVINLKALLSGTPENNVKQLRLFINSLEIEGAAPIGWYINGDDGLVKFLMQRTPASNKTWNALLGYPEFGEEFFDIHLAVSTGLMGHSPIPTDVDNNKKFSFVRISPPWLAGCIVLILIYFGVLFMWARKTPMLRDAPADLTQLGIPGLAAGNAPYSLGKVQMAFWFSIVLTSYAFIWLITDDYELINSGTLVLIGIGAGTGLGAISINNNKEQAAIKKIKILQAQQNDLKQATAQLTAMLPAAGVDEKINYNAFLENQLTTNINELINNLKIGKDNFLNDILSDENGISFHRLQMVAFTIVLGMVFIYSVWANLSMPDFSPTLLTMQGITAGTYLGFKVPEKQGGNVVS